MFYVNTLIANKKHETYRSVDVIDTVQKMEKV